MPRATVWGWERFADVIDICSPLPADELAGFSLYFSFQAVADLRSLRRQILGSLNVRGVFPYQLDLSASHLSCMFTVCCAYKSTYLKQTHICLAHNSSFTSLSPQKGSCATEGRGDEIVRSERILS